MTTEVKDSMIDALKKAFPNKNFADKLADLNMEDIARPKEEMRRINALKNIQLEKLKHEVKFFEELNALELKYAVLNEPLLAQRAKLVCGEYEPTESEATWYLDDEEENKHALGDITNSKKAEEVSKLIKDMKAKTVLSEAESQESVKGLPDFWLQVLKSSDLVSEMVQECDEPILSYLRDIRVKLDASTPFTYTLEFHFDENPYFSNSVLTKSYDMSMALDPNDPFNFDGPEIYKCTGCTIEWKEGKNVTVTQITKKQKHKATGTTRVVNSEEKTDSFFNFFSLPTADGIKPSYKKAMMQTDADKQVAIIPKKKEGEEGEEEEEDPESLDEELCDSDFEIGHFFKEYLIPRAGLYFTGDLNDEYEGEDDEDDMDEDDEDEDEDDEDMDEDDDEEDDEEEEKLVKPGKKGGKGPNPNECKQN